MRIIILGTRGLPPRYGGRETATDEIGARLVRMGHDVVVYGRSTEDGRSAYAYRGIEVVDLPCVSLKGIDSLIHVLYSAFDLIFRRVRGTVVLSDVGTSVAVPLLRLFGYPTVWWVDGPAWERSKWGWFGRNYLRLAATLGIRLSNEVIIDSQVAAKFYEDRYGRSGTFIPYGASVDEHPRQEILDELGLDPAGYVLFVGRLTPEKGVHHLVKAFADVQSDQRLVIVGDNPYDQEYVQSLRSTDDKRITFLGYRFGEEFSVLMKSCSLYVQPSEVEGTSPVVLAAMAYARPVIVQGIPENLETVGDAALSFAPGHADLLAGMIQGILDDPNAAAEWGRKAKRRVEEHYDWDDISNRFAAVCQSAGGKSKT